MRSVRVACCTHDRCMLHAALHARCTLHVACQLSPSAVPLALALATPTTHSHYPLPLPTTDSPPPAQLSSEQADRPKADLVGSGTPFGAAHAAVGAGDGVEAAEQGLTLSTVDHSVHQTRSRTRALRYAPAKPDQPVLRMNQSALAPRSVPQRKPSVPLQRMGRTVSDYPSAHTVQTPSLRCSPTLHGAQSTALESGSDTPPMHICSRCLDMPRLRFCRHRFARIRERKRTHRRAYA
jgi:hypothetical protein